MELTTPGWAETIIIVLVLGGIQLIMLGITGEYIWRNLEESRKDSQLRIRSTSRMTSHSYFPWVLIILLHYLTLTLPML